MEIPKVFSLLEDGGVSDVQTNSQNVFEPVYEFKYQDIKHQDKRLKYSESECTVCANGQKVEEKFYQG